MKIVDSDQIEYYDDKIKHLSAGGFVFFESKSTRKLYVALLQKENGGFFIPKGHLKKGEKPQDAAEREIREELGLKNDTLKLVANIGADNYTFKLPEDNRLNYKCVQLFVFRVLRKEKLMPLMDEGFVNAEWFEFSDALEKIQFDKENLTKARQEFYIKKEACKFIAIDDIRSTTVTPVLTTPESDSIKKSTIRILKNHLGANLLAIVSTGSMAYGEYKDSWSDVDLLLVVEDLNFETKKKIATATKILERRNKRDFGINVITKQEFQEPILPTISLDGKTLQTMLNLGSSPERMIFSKENQNLRGYLPNSEDVIGYSISNLLMFLLRNRKTSTTQIQKSLSEYRKVLTKEIRASFTMVKLAVQYFACHSCDSNAKVIEVAEKYFKDFNFEVLRANLELIDQWDKVRKIAQLEKALESTDDFIEGFAKYILIKIRNNRK